MPVRAAVVVAEPQTFTVAQRREIATPPAAVWAALVHPERWWDGKHSWSGDVRNLALDARGGGCFCETWPGGSVEHLRVVFAQPGKRLRMTGGLGPLQAYPVIGVLTVDLAPSATGTTLVLTYAVAGRTASGLEVLAAPVDAMLGAQVDRLARLIATGAP